MLLPSGQDDLVVHVRDVDDEVELKPKVVLQDAAYDVG